MFIKPRVVLEVLKFSRKCVHLGQKNVSLLACEKQVAKRNYAKRDSLKHTHRNTDKSFIKFKQIEPQ